MENASKALIIAGAILVAILIISVGIAVIQSTGGIQEQVGSQMDAAELKTFNAQFDSYIGTNKTAAQVRALFQQINASNSTNSYKVSMFYGTTELISTEGVIAEGASTTISTLSTRSRYTISADQIGGAYSVIKVTEV